MQSYVTNNYNIQYKKKLYKNKSTVTIELLRRKYYKKVLQDFKTFHNDSIISDKKLEEIFSYFIINSKNTIDPILTNEPNYDISLVETILQKNIKTDYSTYYSNFKEVLKKTEMSMKKNYKLFTKDLQNIKEEIKIEKDNKNGIIIFLYAVYENDIISFSIHVSLYKHLIKLYAIRNFNTYQNVDYVADLKEFNERVFILFCRYNYLASGSTQASIHPQLKLKLLELLNIKIELFASGINSSYTNYCSLFYDIEQYFGSLGSFFFTKIKAGYYEANPPFEQNIINDMFSKMYEELNDAENNKRPLLFFIIIPKMDLTKTPYVKMRLFLKNEKLFDKSELKYMYYDSTFSYAITRSIIDTYALIFHTSYIKESVKKNVIRFFTMV